MELNEVGPSLLNNISGFTCYKIYSEVQAKNMLNLQYFVSRISSKMVSDNEMCDILSWCDYH